MSVKPGALKQALRELSVELTAICSNINYGGCAVVAAIAGKELQALGIELDIVTPINHGYATPKQVRERIVSKNQSTLSTIAWDSNGIDRGHLAVRLRIGRAIYSWDSDGLRKGSVNFGKHNDKAKYPFGDGMTVKECKGISSRATGWNHMFDRSNIPALRKVIKRKLKALS